MGKRKTAQSAPAAGEGQVAPRASSKKIKNLREGRAYVNATYNNTVVSVTDISGNVLAWATAGTLGFAGPKKATPFAASKIVAVVAEKLKGMGVQTLDVFVKGIGGGRDSAIRSLANQGFELRAIRDVTPIPHNGPKPKKTRRV